MLNFSHLPLLRKATALTLSAALILTTLPPPPAWAQMGGFGGGADGGGILGGMNKALELDKKEEAPADDAEPEEADPNDPRQGPDADPAEAGTSLLPDTNLFGYDYRSFDVPSSDVAVCRRACVDEDRCQAWTYVEPGIQGPLARCSLKDSVPQRTQNECCTSGVKGEDSAAALTGGSVEAESEEVERRPEATEPARAPRNAEMATEADGLKLLLDRFRTMRSMDPTPTTPAEVLDETGPDPSAVHAWVRDNVLLVPYSGRLRGAAGTLRDRRGNSVDQALLVRAILQEAGIEARLVRATLPASQRSELLGLMAKAPRDGGPVAPPPNDTRAAEEYALAVTRLESQAPEVLSALASVRKQQPHTQMEWERKKAFRAASEHWWVRIEENGVPVDIDPTLERVGDARMAEPEVAVPEDHEVSIRLMARLRSGQTTSMLEVTWPAADIAGQRITFDHLPNIDITGTDLTPLAMASAWLPAISIGGDRRVGKVIDSGQGLLPPSKANLAEFFSRDTPEPTKAQEQALGNIGDSLLGLSRGGGAAEPPAKSTFEFDFLRQQWIEISVRSPGAPPVMERRDLFNLSAQTSSGTDPVAARLRAWSREILFQVETTALPVRGFLDRVIPRIDRLVSDAGRDRSEDSAAAVDVAAAGLSAELDSFALQRWRWNRYSPITFVDRPNIASMWIASKGDETNYEISRQFDIVVNAVGVQPANRVDPFAARVHQGLADTIAESVVLRDPISLDNTSAAQALALVIGVPLRQILDEDEVKTELNDLDPQAKKRIAMEVDAGHVALLFSRPMPGVPQDSRWRVNLNSGQTLGKTGQFGAVYGETVVLSDQRMKSTLASSRILSQAYYHATRCIAAAALCSIAENLFDVADTGGDVLGSVGDMICGPSDTDVGLAKSAVSMFGGIAACGLIAYGMKCPLAAVFGWPDSPPHNRPDDGLGNSHQMSGPADGAGGSNPGPGQVTGSGPATPLGSSASTPPASSATPTATSTPSPSTGLVSGHPQISRSAGDRSKIPSRPNVRSRPTQDLNEGGNKDPFSGETFSVAERAGTPRSMRTAIDAGDAERIDMNDAINNGEYVLDTRTGANRQGADFITYDPVTDTIYANDSQTTWLQNPSANKSSTLPPKWENHARDAANAARFGDPALEKRIRAAANRPGGIQRRNMPVRQVNPPNTSQNYTDIGDAICIEDL